MDDLCERVGAAAAALWSPGDRVAVAVSGGADSVALLHLLVASAATHGGLLSVISVDHGLREDSEADAAWVSCLARDLGLEARSVRVTTGPAEHEARKARYAVFESLPVDVVALAHHLDDQVETLMINLMRGTGLRGAAGMRPRRGRFARPLLAVSAGELRTWLEARDHDWREDPSNTDPRYLRNRIRHQVLPLLDAARGGALANMARSMRLLSEVDAFVTLLASELGPPPWDEVSQVPAPVLRRALLDNLPGAQNHHVDAVLRCIGEGEGSVTVPGGVTLRVKAERLWLVG